jgi:hypothetical protein
MNTKVFAIENQYTQFIKISNVLSFDYDVFPLPNVSSFKSVMDNVRIALNKGYGNITSSKSYAHTRFLILCAEIRLFEPDVILIDHILVDSKNALSGIELAKQFRKNGIKIPILFFSSSPLNKPEIANIRSSVSNCDWLPKGFDGKDNLTREILEKELSPRISKLTGQNRDSIIHTLSATFFSEMTDLDWFRGKDAILAQLESLMSTNSNDYLVEFFEDWHSSKRKDAATLTQLFDSLIDKNNGEH